MMLKKYFSDDLLQIAILFSLLRVDWLSYINFNRVQYPELQEIILGSTSAYTQTQFHNYHNSYGGYGYIHPKNIDLEWTQRSVFDEIRTLSRFNSNRYRRANRQVAAFLVNNYESSQAQSHENVHSANSIQNQNDSPSQDNSQISVESNLIEEGAVASLPVIGGSELTKEEMDLIDILWKQDIDMGVCREMYDATQRQALEKEYELQLHKSQEKKLEEKPIKEESNPWSSIDYYVDDETGEFIACEKTSSASESPDFTTLASESNGEIELPPELDDFSIDDAMTLVSDQTDINPADATLNTPEISLSQLNNPPFNIEQSSVQTQISNGFTVSRSISFEQRWQDLASVLNLNITNAVAMQEINNFTYMVNSNDDVNLTSLSPSSTTGLSPEFSSFPALIENASLTSTSFLTDSVNNSEPIPYHSSEMFDFDENNFSFTNSTQMNSSEEFLSRLLTTNPLDTINLDNVSLPEDFSGMHCRTSVDSASIVPSPTLQELSDSQSRSSDFSNASSFDGLEGATAMNPDLHVQKLSSGCESGYSGSDRDNSCGSFSVDEDDIDDDFVFGNGFGHQINSKYEHYQEYYDHKPLLDYINHNHTYQLSIGYNEGNKKPVMRDKNTDKRRQQSLSRDERRARALKVPISNYKIVNLPIDKFNEMLSKFKLSEAQLALIRDIRRRGKNKLAAQNCRKRKVDSISTLEEDLMRLREHRNSLKKEQQDLLQQTQNYRQKFDELYLEIFQHLRDENGRPLSQNDYSLQQTPNGNFFLLPHRSSSRAAETNTKQKKKSSKND